jgi:hypothetical protein
MFQPDASQTLVETEPRNGTFAGSGRTSLSGTVGDMSLGGEQGQATTQWNVQSRRSNIYSPELHPQENVGETNQAGSSQPWLSVFQTWRGRLIGPHQAS